MSDEHDYDIATNAAGGGTKHHTDPAYDTVGTGGEGTSTGPADYYETGGMDTGEDSDEDTSTLAGPTDNVETAVDPDADRSVPASDITDTNADMRPGLEGKLTPGGRAPSK